MNKYLLTIDLGASNGRGIVFAYDGSGMKPVYEHRFANEIALLHGTAYWDILYLFQNIKTAIRDAAHRFEISSIGIDTWGLDFGLIGYDGNLMENPVAYRDKRTDGIMDVLYQQLPQRDLYFMTGTQCLPGNTIYQLYYLLKNRPELLDRTKKILMMPDLMTYFLTGETHTEFTIASTMQLMQMDQRTWNYELLDRIGLSQEKLTDMIYPGEQAFALSRDLQQELGVHNIPVVSVASHDTASAVISIPTLDEESLYISSGTWSIIGTERSDPLIDETSYRGNYTNEGGFGKTIRYAKSLVGLWLIQECVRCWKEAGITIGYSEIEDQVRQVQPFMSIIDPQDAALQNKCDMPREIARLCEQNHQHIPETVGEFARCIYESMALNYRRSVEILKQQTGRAYSQLYVVGGGSRASFLNQCIADATGITVVAGMPEATAYGNAFAQLYWGSDIASIQDYRGMIRKNESNARIFIPQNTDAWEDTYSAFEQMSQA
ncbi:MAG: rhamnulokinase family protein [Clostridia bacterium]